MDRMACIDIRGLPLQLLLRRHPAWAQEPVVVVDRDKPTGRILWANEQAQTWRILPGMRYAAGLALSGKLRGAVVADQEIAEAVTFLAQQLWRFSPRIEPAPREPGIFWLDASGMRHLFPSLEVWANSICADLLGVQFRAVVAVGFSRFGVYAAARACKRPVIVFQSAEEERTQIRRVPLEQLGLEPALRDTLFKLGIHTLGAFIDLPAEGIRKRFGAAAEALHGRARRDGMMQLEPCPLYEPAERTEMLDYPEEKVDRLLALLTGLLHGLVDELAARQEQVKSLRVALTLRNGAVMDEEVSPAAPTCDMSQLLLLLRLRLEALTLGAPVTAITLAVSGVGIAERQLSLFREARRDMEPVYRAFAKLRAEYGNSAVLCARVREGHLPEASYGLEPLEQLAGPCPVAVAMGPLVRRIYTPAIELPPRARHEPDGWMIAGMADGPVEEVIGPQLISGGWWIREITRAYYYVRTRSGRWLWIYHDLKRRRWFLQGEVQ